MLRLKSKTNFDNSSRKGQQGFSIIEMAIVFLIIAILAAIAIPQVLNYLKRYRVGVASRNVATALQRARFLATSNNKRAGINIAEERNVKIEEYDPDGKLEPMLKGSVFLPEGVAISSDAPRQVAFDGRGIVTPMPKESPKIRLNGDSGYFQVVTVNATGQVTVSDMSREERE
jgi:prepilin-type N-terminal cleavage/methylation domain-containing protein